MTRSTGFFLTSQLSNKVKKGNRKIVEMLVCLENADLFGLGFSMGCRPSNRQFTTSIWITTTLRWQEQLLGSTPPYSDEVKKEDRKIVEMLVCLELQSYLVWVFLCCYRSSNRQLHYKYWTITILQRKDQLVKEGNRRIVGMLVCFEIAELFGFWVSLCIGRLSCRRIFLQRLKLSSLQQRSTETIWLHLSRQNQARRL